MKLELHPDVVSDIRALPNEAAQRAAIDTISQIRQGRREGKPLEYRAGTGDLRDCRKCYFDAPGREDKPRFRLVYHVTSEDNLQVLAAEVVAVGERADLAAYHEAAIRLGRHPNDGVPADSDDGRS
ncbi:hypothetical protein [Cellulomonas phragmiteti]|uniref:Cytotoxic translational repressor of toxin-antitoxin stability system n=1 Tax=Cellulomonas phragmiteti TaxID=478780 RepID=A0ABQ4DIY7_9CELL|nr:hypothetical protein [Cellulomonas phragmiteti]GIG39305.1 hypothetical protein Cph01nite_10670 [Cellulomonas phragmiteti]